MTAFGKQSLKCLSSAPDRQQYNISIQDNSKNTSVQWMAK